MNPPNVDNSDCPFFVFHLFSGRNVYTSFSECSAYLALDYTLTRIYMLTRFQTQTVPVCFTCAHKRSALFISLRLFFVSGPYRLKKSSRMLSSTHAHMPHMPWDSLCHPDVAWLRLCSAPRSPGWRKLHPTASRALTDVFSRLGWAAVQGTSAASARQISIFEVYINFYVDLFWG